MRKEEKATRSAASQPSHERNRTHLLALADVGSTLALLGFSGAILAPSNSPMSIGGNRARASSECPTSSKASVASFPDSVTSTSSPPGCSSMNLDTS